MHDVKVLFWLLSIKRKSHQFLYEYADIILAKFHLTKALIEVGPDRFNILSLQY